MKKIYLTATAIVVATGAFAQSFVQQQVTSTVAKEVVFPTPNAAAATPDDTLGWDELGNQLIQYGSDAGYVFGTNSIEFPAPAPAGTFQFNLEYARSFVIQDPQTVIGAGFIFGAKTDVSGDPSAVTAKLYALEQDAAVSVLANPLTYDADGPGSTVKASGAIAFADADTVFPNVTWVDFDSEGWVSSDFVIGLDITSLYGAPSDTIVLMADAHNDSDGNSTFTRFTQGANTSGPSVWAQSTALLIDDLFLNLAIFAVVAESPNSIEEQTFIDGVKATTYPNPGLTSDNITIQYGVEKAVKNVDVTIFNMNGQMVFTTSEGDKASGNYNVTVPAGTLSAGTYTYLVQADDSRIAKRMVILK
ncbi:MAG: hypothetical protein ACI9EQ_001448 [Bacteroidia bacterium]|jgi:hypothetical protein